MIPSDDLSQEGDETLIGRGREKFITPGMDERDDYDVNTQSLSMSRAADILGVSTKTLRNWDEKRKINVVRTPGGHRRIPLKEISRLLAGEKLGMESESAVESTISSFNQALEGQEFLKSFGLENVDFLQPEKTDMSLLPKEGLFDNLNRDQVNCLTRQLVHKMEDVLSCRLIDAEYQKLANIVAMVHDRGTNKEETESKPRTRPGVPSQTRG